MTVKGPVKGKGMVIGGYKEKAFNPYYSLFKPGILLKLAPFWTWNLSKSAADYLKVEAWCKIWACTIPDIIKGI